MTDKLVSGLTAQVTPAETDLYMVWPVSGGLLLKQSMALARLSFNQTVLAVEDSIVAHAGGTQALARLLTAHINRIITVGTAADSVRLPFSAIDKTCILINDGANSMQVFGLGTDTINGVATATGVAHAAGVRRAYYSLAPGAWYT